MEYRQLGNSGARVSVIGLGTNQFGSKVSADAVKNIVDVSIDSGINFIDTADIYTEGRSEETLGQALKGRWDRFVLATKFESPAGSGPNDHGASRYHLMNALEASLRRLQSDHIDLYYVHWWDDTTPIEETLRALDDLMYAGKVRYIGASNFAAWQLANANVLAKMSGWTPFVTAQNHYNMLERGPEREMLPFCRAHNVGLVPYFPLAGGFLTGKYRRGRPAPSGSRGESAKSVQQYMTDGHYGVLENLAAWAQARGRALNELAEAWLLAQPKVVSVISGATRAEHVLANAKAANWTLTPEEVAEINAILEQQVIVERV
jgi:aryl-alcohol dehydrogenase-like predicted oxidoreductase